MRKETKCSCPIKKLSFVSGIIFTDRDLKEICHSFAQ